MERQTVFCSATIESSVAHLIDVHLKKNAVRVAVGSTTKPAEHIELHVYEVEQDRKLGLLEKMLRDDQGSFLVFARTKHGADRLAKKLARGGSKATAIHGNRTQSQRNQALRGFQDGNYRVLVATDVAARGVHVEGIAHVVNYDLPQVPEDFIHRVGRTGRAGLHAEPHPPSARRDERSEIRKIERLLDLRLTPQPVPAGIEREARGAHQRRAASGKRRVTIPGVRRIRRSRRPTVGRIKIAALHLKATLRPKRLRARKAAAPKASAR